MKIHSLRQVLAEFWALFAYSVGTFNLGIIHLLVNILGGVLGIVITIQILKTIYPKTAKS